MPLASGPAELGSIVSKLKNDTNSTPYAFYAGDVVFLEHYKSSERIHLQEPALTLAPSCVQSETASRCAETCRASDAVLHVQFSPDGKVAWEVGMLRTFMGCARASAFPRRLQWTQAPRLCLSWSPMQGWSRPEIEWGSAGLAERWRVSGAERHSKWITALAWLPCHLADASQTHCELLASASKDCLQNLERQDRAKCHVAKRPF